MNRYINKIQSLAKEFSEKGNFFSPFESMLFTLAPYLKVFNKQKHEAIIRKLMPRFNVVMKKVQKEGKYLNKDITADAPIWILWMQGEDNMPPLIRACVKSIKENAGTHPVHVLNADNIENYVNIPTIINDKLKQKIITFTHFSDIVRMALLSKYGGYWIDSTIYMTQPLTTYNMPFYSIRQKVYSNRFVECTNGSNWSAYFVACGEKNIYPQIIYQFFIDYWQHNNCMIDYFLIDYAIAMLYRTDRSFHEIIHAMPYDVKNVNILRLNMNQNYSLDLWKELTQSRYNKLSWKLSFDLKDDTIAKHLLSK